MKPQFSVLIPAYNHGAFLAEAVTSCLKGDVDDLEVVVVDDGSTDDTPEVLKAFAGDSRVIVHHQENRGADAALNRLLGLARGEILFILNSDDAFEPARIPRLAREMEAHPEAVIACSWLNVVDAQGHAVGVKKAWHTLPPWPSPAGGRDLADLGDPRLALLQTNWAATSSNLAFRRALVFEAELSFAPLRYCHDWDFLLRAALLGPILAVEEPLLRYRVHESNTLREGAAGALGEAVMRFEILWTVARAAAPLLAEAGNRGFSGSDLQERVGRSLPTFGRENLLCQLLALRGAATDPPPAYDDLLRPEHPFREAAIDLLSNPAPGSLQ